LFLHRYKYFELADSNNDHGSFKFVVLCLFMIIYFRKQPGWDTRISSIYCTLVDYWYVSGLFSSLSVIYSQVWSRLWVIL